MRLLHISSSGGGWGSAFSVAGASFNPAVLADFGKVRSRLTSKRRARV